MGFLAGGPIVSAQLVYWDGGGNQPRWSVAQNWNPDGVPTASDHIVFDNSFVASLPNIELRGDQNANTLTFDTANTFSLVNGPGPARTLQLHGGDITRTAASSGTQTLDFGALELQTSGIWDIQGAGSFVVNSVISESTAGLGITKTGGGLLLLNAGNTYTGTTAIDAGTLRLGAADRIADTSAVTIASGATFDLNSFSETVASISGAGAITLGTGANTLTVGGNNSSTTFSGAISGSGNLVKTGLGNLLLSGSSSYTGTTTVSQGTLTIQSNTALGSTAGGTTVANGATLAVQGGGVSSAEPLTLAGSGVGGVGALHNVTGANTMSGFVTLTGNTTIGSSASGNLFSVGSGSRTVDIDSHVLTFTGAGDIRVNSEIIGTGDLLKTGSGTLILGGNKNSYTGDTTIAEGTLLLSTNIFSFPNEAIVGNIFVGDGAGASDSAVLRHATGGSNMIADTSIVTINTDGLMDLNNQNDTIGGLVMTGGRVTTGVGNLFLGGNLTTNASSETALIEGNLSLNFGTRIFTVADGAATNDLHIDARILHGSLEKEGAGRLLVTGNNEYALQTRINAGVLTAAHNNALGATGGSLSSGTVVANGAALELSGTISIGNEALSLTGAGVSNTGALRNVSGANTYGGNVTLAGNTRINADMGGSLTLTGAMTIGSNELTVGGAGTTQIAGAIASGSGGLTKDGTGTLILSGSNNYGGATNITSGIVNVRHSFGLGNVSGGTTVASGAALELQNNIGIGSEALSLSGTGVSGGGALRNVGGTNSFGGAIALSGGTTRINSDAGTLTLSGGVSGAGQNLTVGGAGDTVISGAIATTTGSLTKDGSGMLTLSSSTSNSYTGGTFIDSGILRLGASNQIADSTSVNIASGATFEVSGFTDTIGALTGAGTLTIGSGTLIVGSGDASMTFSGSFTNGGSGSFVKTGGGTLTFGADMNFSTGSLVLSGGTVNLGDFTHSFNALSVTADSILDFGSGASIINFNSVNVSSGVLLTVVNWTDTVDFFYATQNPGDTILNRIVFNPPTFTTDDTRWLSHDTQITPVPEPSTYGAILMGVLFVAFGIRRRLARSAPTT